MTEKQRWLLRDLEAWREKQMEKIGRYGPHREPLPPARVRAAKHAAAKAAIVIREWERTKKAPWDKERAAIVKRVEGIKRIILFEKTEDALKAMRALI